MTRNLYALQVDEEADDAMLQRFQHMPDDQLCSLIEDQFGIDFYDIEEICAAAWCNDNKTIYVKFLVDSHAGNLSTLVAAFSLDGQRFKAAAQSAMTPAAAAKHIAMKQAQDQKPYALSLMFGS